MRDGKSSVGLRSLDIVLAYTFLRIIVGINYYNHGFTRIDSIPNFIQAMVERFQGTYVPEILVTINAALVPPVELVVGLLITLGWFTRAALIACFCLMFVLMYGVTLLQEWDIASSQLIYNLVLFILLAGLGYNQISVDRWLKRRRGPEQLVQTQEPELPSRLQFARLPIIGSRWRDRQRGH
ncbi:MAG: DoxX family protein [Chloroflexaceae bacterium]|nr:DoxX family protein [Chloroflexaceae bacterium]